MAFGAQIWDFRTIAMDWSSMGMFDILLPMLLIFTIVYAVLQRTKILGDKQPVNAIVALIVGFFTMGNPQISQFFLPLFSNAALGLAIFAVFLLLMGLIMPGAEEGTWNNITLIGGVAMFFWIMSRAADYFGDYLIFSRSWWANNAGWIIPLILVIIVIGLVASDSGSKPKTPKGFQAMYMPTQ